MASLDSINEKLNFAVQSLDQAATEIHELPLQPTGKHLRLVGEALANVFQIQQEIRRLRPDLEPWLAEEEPEPDPSLTPNQEELVAELSDEDLQEIDRLLLSHATHSWRKVAMLVGLAMRDNKGHKKGVPDILYSQRVRKLVEQGRLVSEGNLQYMRFSEVRLPDAG